MRNDTSVDVNFSQNFTMVALRYGGPSLWRPFAIVAHYQSHNPLAILADPNFNP